MKILYENPKATSTDVGGKIDELKKVLSMQGDFFMKPAPASNHFGSFQNQQLDLMDPTIVKKGIEDIKD